MTKKIDPDDLTGIMLLLDSVRYLFNEIQDGFFDKYDPSSDTFEITYDFPRNRAKSNAVHTLLFDMEKELLEMGASTGRPDKQKEEAQKEVSA